LNTPDGQQYIGLYRPRLP